MSTVEKEVYGIKRKEINYKDKNSTAELTKQIHKLIVESKKSYKEIILLCIGTDRSTGDSFAPMLGTLLSKRKELKDKVKIIGTLQNPVHAKNLIEKMKELDIENSLIIAIDACLGEKENIGNITITNGGITPGAALNKNLPLVGDISIAGIVNFSCKGMEFTILQNTRFVIVYDMVNKLELAINKSIKQLYKENNNTYKFKKVI